MDENILKQLLSKAKEILSTNTRFHDFGHAQEVLEITRSIIKKEGGDEEILIPAVLFHDASSHQDNCNEGEEGARIVEDVLRDIPNYPEHKIEDSKRLIRSLNREPNGLEEIILNDADSLAAFSYLSICRAFMMYGAREIDLYHALKDFSSFISKKIQHFRDPNREHTKISRSIAEDLYSKISLIIDSCTQLYPKDE